MLSVVDETDDDWQAVTSLGSWDDFDDFFQQKYIDSECFASGCTVVITNGDGVVHRRRFGGHKDGSIFCVYSVTKIVTTIACLQLRDAGKLRLDDRTPRAAAASALCVPRRPARHVPKS